MHHSPTLLHTMTKKEVIPILFTIIGGDLRSVHLCHRLISDGHQVRSFGLELGNIPPYTQAPSLESALQDTQCVILPIPVCSDSLLRAPYACAPIPMEAVCRATPQGIPVFGGGSCPIPMTDLTRHAAMAVGNAALTVQGALLLMLQNTMRPLKGQQVLILGGGRIGTLLGLQLKDMGAAVTVASRRRECKAWHTAMGMQAADISDPKSLLPWADIVVNTVPVPILDTAALKLLHPSALLLELASLPGGFDPVQAEALGYTAVIARGLPGTFTPQGAADLIAETIYHELELSI